jgi:hypothetical protein
MKSALSQEAKEILAHERDEAEKTKHKKSDLTEIGRTRGQYAMKAQANRRF